MKKTFYGNVALHYELQIDEADVPRSKNGDIDYEAIKKIVTTESLIVISWPQTIRTLSEDRTSWVTCTFDANCE